VRPSVGVSTWLLSAAEVLVVLRVGSRLCYHPTLASPTVDVHRETMKAVVVRGEGKSRATQFSSRHLEPDQ
jgi:hypothetical protein